MQRVQILLHHLTLQLLHSTLEQLLNRWKKRRCRNINTLHDSCHFFTPVTIETTGVFGPRTTEFLKELGLVKLTHLHTLPRDYQQGNAASVLGTMKVDIEDEEFFV